MINATFQVDSDLISVKIEGNNLAFFDVGTGLMTTLEGIKFSKAGVLKEFPDLKDNPDWKLISMERLKNHIKSFKTEMEKINYVKDELIKFGYKALFYQVAGFRTKKFK